jgi:hypothetical protein
MKLNASPSKAEEKDLREGEWNRQKVLIGGEMSMYNTLISGSEDSPALTDDCERFRATALPEWSGMSSSGLGFSLRKSSETWVVDKRSYSFGCSCTATMYYLNPFRQIPERHYQADFVPEPVLCISLLPALWSKDQDMQPVHLWRGLRRSFFQKSLLQSSIP